MMLCSTLLSMLSQIPHRIERTRNRHSRAVYRNDTIIIRLAKNLSKTQEQEHIDSLLRRMIRSVQREQQRQRVDPFRPLLQGDPSLSITLANGTSYVFDLQPGPRTRAARTTIGWRITVSPAIRRPQLHRFLWKLLSTLEHERITTLVHAINDETYRERLGTIRLSYAVTQWGSCSRHRDIHLNPVLLFLPEELLRYVIIHELAHCTFRNHSKRYWHWVARACPDHEALRRALRKIRICKL